MNARSARRAAATLCFALLLSGRVTPARASPNYPGIVATVVGAASPPPCTVCHETTAGGFGTATKPLAVYLRSRGLVAANEDSLRRALAAAGAEMDDADDDGTSDIEELKTGADPNVAGADSRPPPVYGCGNVAGAAPTGVPFAAASLLALMWALRRRPRPRAWRDVNANGQARTNHPRRSTLPRE